MHHLKSDGRLYGVDDDRRMAKVTELHPSILHIRADAKGGSFGISV